MTIARLEIFARRRQRIAAAPFANRSTVQLSASLDGPARHARPGAGLCPRRARRVRTASGSLPRHRVAGLVAVVALASLELPKDASPALAGFMIHSHTLGKAQVTLTYGR